MLRISFINMRRRHHTFEAKLRNASTLLRLGRTSQLVLPSRSKVHFSPFSLFLSQCDIEYHHNNKAYGKGDSTNIGVLALLGLGDKFLDNDVEHSTCRECKEVG